VGAFLKYSFLSLLGLLLFAPNLRTIFKYANSFAPFFFLAYVVLFAFMTHVLVLGNSQLVKRIIGNWWYVLFVIAAISLVVMVGYPIADGLKVQMRGSDQDDCVIMGVNKIVELNHPYLEKSYGGNPCSPGMGMLLLYMPFVVVNFYHMGAIFYAAIAAIAIKIRTGSLYSAAAFLTLLFGSLFVVELLVVGSDLFLIGCGFVLLALMVERLLLSRNIWILFSAAVLCGLLASTRVNFLVVVPVFAFFIFMHWKQGAIFFAVLASLVAIVPSGYVYFLDPSHFTPFHLLEKKFLAFQGLKELGAFFSVVFFLIAAYMVKRSVNFVPAALLISLSPSLMAVALADLMYVHWDFSAWEGANYLLPLSPLAVYALVVNAPGSVHSEKELSRDLDNL
jgi:hypothetical protein